jgi:hypothetical protein
VLLALRTAATSAHHTDTSITAGFGTRIKFEHVCYDTTEVAVSWTFAFLIFDAAVTAASLSNYPFSTYNTTTAQSSLVVDVDTPVVANTGSEFGF